MTDSMHRTKLTSSVEYFFLCNKGLVFLLVCIVKFLPCMIRSHGGSIVKNAYK